MICIAFPAESPKKSYEDHQRNVKSYIVPKKQLRLCVAIKSADHLVICKNSPALLELLRNWQGFREIIYDTNFSQKHYA